MKIRPLLLALTILMLDALSVCATDIRSIDTEVWLHKNGNAVVHQRWDVTITGGTEWYIPIGNLGQRNIRGFTVIEKNQVFESDGRSWNSDRTLEQKKFRCGIVEKSDGVELCWGQGEAGEHVYDIIYIIDNLVQASSDGENDVFNWQFLNDEWNAPPDSVSLTLYNYADSTYIWKAGEGGNMGVWVFGCEAEYQPSDSSVVITSTESFRYGSHLTVLMRFDKGLFKPATTESRTFEQLQFDAFLGSDYHDAEDDDGKLLPLFIRILIGILFIPAIVLLLALPFLLKRLYLFVSGCHYDKRIFGRRRITGWSRDLPLGGHLSGTFSLLVHGDEFVTRAKTFDQLVGAYFLRWIHQGLVIPEKDPVRQDHYLLRFTSADAPRFTSGDQFESILYTKTREAAGTDLLLEPNEFGKYSKTHYREVVGWPDRAASIGRDVWNKIVEQKRVQAVQFKNYLKDFTLSSERDVPEVTLWQEYLVFAQLFGIADKISAKFKRLYPDTFAAYMEQSHLVNASASHAIMRSVRMSSSSLVSAANAAFRAANTSTYSSSSSSSSSTHRRYSGGGGHSSHRGGGGHSGGGHGGGSR